MDRELMDMLTILMKKINTMQDIKKNNDDMIAKNDLYVLQMLETLLKEIIKIKGEMLWR